MTYSTHICLLKTMYTIFQQAFLTYPLGAGRFGPQPLDILQHFCFLEGIIN